MIARKESKTRGSEEVNVKKKSEKKKTRFLETKKEIEREQKKVQESVQINE